MNEIDLMLDEENELTFQLDVEGTRPGDVECRLVIEAQDMSLTFESDKYKGGEVNVTLPPLDHILKEGAHGMTLEVLVDDRRFIPLTITGNFEKGVSVTAEAKIPQRKKRSKASASLVEVTSSSKPKVIHKKQEAKSEKKKIEVSDEKIMEIIKLIQRKN